MLSVANNKNVAQITGKNLGQKAQIFQQENW